MELRLHSRNVLRMFLYITVPITQKLNLPPNCTFSKGLSQMLNHPINSPSLHGSIGGDGDGGGGGNVGVVAGNAGGGNVGVVAVYKEFLCTIRHNTCTGYKDS
jgi:hypothetical protein